MTAAALEKMVGRFQGTRILVVGDLVADEYIFGAPSRISREAPVLILRYSSREVRLGGAANSCHNVHALGGVVWPVGVIGKDQPGGEIRAILEEKGISTQGIVIQPDRSTPVKTRIMAGGYHATRQQVVRVDREPNEPLTPSVEAQLIEQIRRCKGRVDGLLLSDYGYGTLTPAVLEGALGLGREEGVVVTADSRYDLLRFHGVTAATPNEPEVEHLLGRSVEGEAALEKAGWELLERLGSRLLLITRGSRGMALFERGGLATFLPIVGSDQVADVTGAGDTVISTFTLALVVGAPPVAAAHLSNHAGSIVVMKRGTAAVLGSELVASVRGERDGG